MVNTQKTNNNSLYNNLNGEIKINNKINDTSLDNVFIGATLEYMGNILELSKLESRGWYPAYIINPDGSLGERRKFSKIEFAEAFGVFGDNGNSGDNNLFYLPDVQNRAKRHIGNNITYKELQNFATSLNGISASTSIAQGGDHSHDMSHEHTYIEAYRDNKTGGSGSQALDLFRNSSTTNCTRNTTGTAGGHIHNATTTLSGGAIETRGDNFGVISLFKLKNAKIASLNRFDKLTYAPLDNIFLQNSQALNFNSLNFSEVLNQGDISVVFKNGDGTRFVKYFNANAFVPFDVVSTTADLLPSVNLVALNIKIRVFGIFDMVSSNDIKELSMSLLSRADSLLDSDYASKRAGDTNKPCDFNFVVPLGDRTINEGFNFILQNISGNDFNISRIEIFITL